MLSKVFFDKGFLTVLTVLAVAAVAIGCGGSGGDGSGDEAALSKAEFIRQGDAICKKQNLRLAQEFGKFAKEKHLSNSNPYDSALQEEMVETVAMPSLQRQAEELDGLAGPSTGEAEANRIIDGIEAAVEEVEADPSKFPAPTGPLASLSKSAQRYGFKVCLQG